MSTKHTPGPWKVAKSRTINGNANLYQIHWSDDGECVAEIVHGEPDARLIAAAPEMLAALELARQWLEGWASADRELSIINSVIAKATGAKTDG